MKTLPKSFSASTNRIPVVIENRHFEIANLLKSGTLNQTTILVGDGEKWQQVRISDLGINYVNLNFVAEVFEKQNFTLAQLGFDATTQVSIPERDLMVDFSRLHVAFPAYSIDNIGDLHNHVTKFNRRSSYEDLKGFLRMISERTESVQDYIERSDFETSKILAVKKHTVLAEGGNKDSFYNIGTVSNGLKFGIYYDIKTGFKRERFESEELNLPDELAAIISCSYRSMDYLKSLLPNTAAELFFTEIQSKFKTIKQMEFTKLRENRLKSLGLKYNASDDTFEGNGLSVSGNQIETLTVDEWETLVENLSENINAPMEFTPPSPEDVAHVERKLPVGFEPLDLSGVPPPNNEEPVSVMGTYPGTQDEEDDLVGAVADYRRDHPEPVAPAPESAPATRAMSITTIEGLDPLKIKEFKDLSKETDKILKANPIIEVTDKITLEKAKKQRAVLLKSCTAIDGKEGLLASTKKAFNTAKSLFDSFLTSAAEPRRKQYNEQDEIIIRFEKAEEIRLAAEQAAKLEKLNKRRDELYAVPMTFNGSLYNVGAVYILPSQIETATDEEFAALVQLAKNAVQVEADKDARIKELEAMLAAAKGVPAVNAPEAVQGFTDAINNSGALDKHGIITDVPAPAPPSASKPIRYQYPSVFIAASEKNDILARLDSEHLDSISKDPIPGGFITARGYFIRGTKDTAQAVMDIMNAPTQEGVFKSQLIADLCKVILTQP